MAKREKKAGAGQVAARLRALIAAKGLSSSAELGELLDVGDTRARNWLNGTATMPVSFAIQLATLWKAPILEWVFAGVPDFLPHALVRAMEQGYVTGTEALASQPIDGSPKPSRKVSLFEQEVALIALWREISLERKEVVFRAAGGDPGILAS